jgi:hypothetical protein
MSLSFFMANLHATLETHIEKEMDKNSIILPLVTCKTSYIIHHYYQSRVQFTNLNHYGTLKMI